MLEVIAVVMGVAIAGTVIGIVDAVRQPDRAWHAAEQKRSTWIAVMVVLPIAFVAYWGSVRPQLRSAL